MVNTICLSGLFVFCGPKYHLRIKPFTLAISKILTKLKLSRHPSTPEQDACTLLDAVS